MNEDEALKDAASRAHRMLMGFMLNPQEMEVVCQLNDAIEQARLIRNAEKE